MKIKVLLLPACFQALLMYSFVRESSSSQAKVSGVIGKTVEIPCDLPFSEDVKTVSWRKLAVSELIYSFDARSVPLLKGEHHTSDSRFHFLPLEQPPILHLKDITLKDEGKYICMVFYKNFQTDQYITSLRVIVPPSDINIIDNKSNVIDKIYGPVNEKSIIEITCEVKGGRPSPMVAWWQDSKLLDKEVDNWSSNTKSNILKFGPLTREDHGRKLTCQAINSKISSPLSVEVTLDVLYPPSELGIIFPNKPLVAHKQSKIICQSDRARPSPILSWWVDGVQIVSTRDQIWTNDSTVISTLFYTPKVDDRTKVITCKAESPDGEYSPLIKNKTLNIHHSPKVSLTRVTNEDPVEGAEVSLKCSTDANPPVTSLTWFRKGVKIDPKLEESTFVVDNILTLQNISRGDSGIYSCLATNHVGTGKSEGLLIYVKYVPVCHSLDSLLIGASLHEEVEIKCSLNSSSKIEKFRWQFTNSNESLDIPEDDFNFEEKQSLLTYTPRSSRDFGFLKCWGTNDLGEQREPCVIEVVEATVPDSLQNCTINQNITATSFFVSCLKGHDGGLEQIFIAQIMDLSTNKQLRNVSASEPKFFIQNLPPGTEFLLTLYARNIKGNSEEELLEAYTEAYADNSLFSINSLGKFPITSLLGVLIGVVGALVIGALIIFVVMRLKSNSLKDDIDCEKGKQEWSPANTNENGEDRKGNIPEKLRHSNLFESPASGELEEVKKTKEFKEKQSDNEGDDVQYAELQFDTKKKKKENKKSKNKDKKEKKKKNSKKTNGEIIGTYDPTVYASIDHVQTEMNKLAADAAKRENIKEKEKGLKDPEESIREEGKIKEEATQKEPTKGKGSCRETIDESPGESPFTQKELEDIPLMDEVIESNL